jgi:hypothetical protein
VPVLALVVSVLAAFGSLEGSGRPRPAVLVLARDLAWIDVPAGLGGYAKANLTMAAARQNATAADAYLTIGKGAPSDAPASGIGPMEPAGRGVRLRDWHALQRHDASLHQTGRLGTLGQALDGSGRPWMLVADDPRASAAAANRRGSVRRVAFHDIRAVEAGTTSGALALIVEVSRPELPTVLQATRNLCVFVASVSSPARNAHLGVFAASPACGLGHQGLRSASTHRGGLVTLADVAPTFLAAVNIPRPRSLAGSAIHADDGGSVKALIRADQRAVTGDQVRTNLLYLFAVLSGLGAALMICLSRARVPVALSVLAIPPASFLMMLFPWWGSGLMGAIAVGGGVAALLAVTATLIGRRDVRLGIGALTATVAAVVAIDAGFGGRLEIDAPFGNSSTGGGRYFGVGNVGFGFLAAGLIVVCALALDRWGRRAVPWIIGALAAGVVLGTGPWFGADVGGLLTAMPAFGVLVFGYRTGRPARRNVLATLAATLGGVLLLVAIDIQRAPSGQTHLARALGSDPVGLVLRKLEAAAGNITSPIGLVIVVGLVALAFNRPRLAGRPALRAAAWALLVAGVLGSAVNDSGLAVAGAVMAIAWPAFFLLAPEPAPGADGLGRRESRALAQP